MNKIAAVVILFNPDFSIIDNIASYCPYVDIIYLWKNSVIDEKLVYILESKFSSKLYWCGNQHNQGIGYALNRVLEECKKNGHIWLLTMDQDSRFIRKGVVRLREKIRDVTMDSSVALISANQNINNKLEHKKNDAVEWVMMSGNFIRVSISIDIGGFNEKLFIDGVDIEFCLRLKFNNYKIIICADAILKHKLGETQDVTFFLFKTRTTNHNATRLYYIFRNYLKIITSANCSGKGRFILIKFLVHKFICVFLFEEDKVKKYKMITKGFIDFILGKDEIIT